jgi:transcriptional regulator with GAF, ATPase, and Fis domain
MSSSDRQVWQVFVQLAGTLVADFDVIEFLHTLAQHCVDLLGVSACGILLADHTGRLNLVATSTEQVRLLELSQSRAVEGPCVDAYRTRAPVSCPDMAAARDRWPDFAPAALSAGFAAVHALPMRLRDQAIGAVSLYCTQPSELGGQAAELGQALADVATIGILHERALHRREAVTEQMQKALSSLITIEQAKGVLAERLHVTIEEAFTLMRAYARDHGLKLADTARAITAGELHITSLG